MSTVAAIALVYSLVVGAEPALAQPAEPVDIVAGGPRGEAQRTQVRDALARAGDALGVCWRGQRPARVSVELAVDRSGRITSSRQKTRGPVAQCAAGVLAVRSLAAVGAGYRVTVSFATRASGGAIDAALAGHRQKLQACGKRARTKSWPGGKATLRFLIRPDGRVAEPELAASDLREPAVERCLTDTLRRLSLGRGLTAKTVSYTLNLTVPGAAASAPTASAGVPKRGASDELQPKKDGPLSGAAISAVMNRHKTKFSACYQAQLVRNPKLAGRVVLRFTIAADGTTRNVKIRDSKLGDAKVESCLVKVGKTLRFPAEPGRDVTRVFYPFVFSAR